MRVRLALSKSDSFCAVCASTTNETPLVSFSLELVENVPYEHLHWKHTPCVKINHPVHRAVGRSPDTPLTSISGKCNWEPEAEAYVTQLYSHSQRIGIITSPTHIHLTGHFPHAMFSRIPQILSTVVKKVVLTVKLQSYIQSVTYNKPFFPLNRLNMRVRSQAFLRIS